MKARMAAGDKFYIPEVIDYEIRRELIRAGKVAGIRKLNTLQAICRFQPITSDAMTLAATLWAQARNSGTATGDPKKLDVDVILAAQALTAGIPPADLIVVTENVKHLAQFVPAREWQDVT
jgi:predicted nucleic acid-binding protein